MTESIVQRNPVSVPVPGGKIIKEHFGLASLGDSQISIAHMIAPPGWSEPHQVPEFDEYTLMVHGRKEIEIDGNKLILGPGESLRVCRGSRVQYSNPFEKPAEYWSVCIPAFTPESAHRE